MNQSLSLIADNNVLLCGQFEIFDPFHRFVTPLEKRWQLYLFLKPQASFFFHNLLLEGNLLWKDTDATNGVDAIQEVAIRHVVFTGDLGLLFSYRALAISLTYKETSGLILNQPSKALGNVSLFFGL